MHAEWSEGARARRTFLLVPSLLLSPSVPLLSVLSVPSSSSLLLSSSLHLP